MKSETIAAKPVMRSKHNGEGRAIAHVAVMFLSVLFLAALTGWGALAIHYGDSHTSTMQTALAAVFGFTGIAVMVGIFAPAIGGRLSGGVYCGAGVVV